MRVVANEVVGDGDATAAANSRARVTDTVSAVLNPDDPNTLKGPDPAEWGAEQLVPPDDLAPRDYEVKGPDPEKWPQTAPEAAQTPPEAVSEQPYNSAPDPIVGVVEPPA